ncbi:centrosomal protein 15 isoform X2 [Petaurus breviceps papuanus]|uniref:centrosomal protein 15 isoform X2 n=1 Tax=Petaurus breviceps papuanus TaxID=3040969 RepID=UPI0036D7EB08
MTPSRARACAGAGGGVAYPREEGQSRSGSGDAGALRGVLGPAASGRGPKEGSPRLAQRLLLLEEMENDHGDQKTEKKASLIKAAKLAYKRNQDLLNDIRTLEEKIEKKVHLRSHPEMVNLQTLYWASVEEQAPKWEQFLLGKAQYPTGVRCQSPAGNDIRDTAER